MARFPLARPGPCPGAGTHSIGVEAVAAERDDMEEADELWRETGQLCILLASLCDGEAGVVVRSVPAHDELVA